MEKKSLPLNESPLDARLQGFSKSLENDQNKLVTCFLVHMVKDGNIRFLCIIEPINERETKMGHKHFLSLTLKRFEYINIIIMRSILGTITKKLF